MQVYITSGDIQNRLVEVKARKTACSIVKRGLIINSRSVEQPKRMKRITVLVTCSLLVGGIFLCSEFVLAEHKKVPEVLIINSYHKGFRWTDEQVSGAEKVLRDAVPEVDIRVEYLDTKRFFNEQYLEELTHFLGIKYGGQEDGPDVVIVTDDNAFRFVMSQQSGMFHGIPIVFSGVDDFDPALVSEKENVTGIIETLDIEGTIDLALSLNKDISKVFVAVDDSPTGAGQLKDVVRIEKEYQQLEFQYLSGKELSSRELVEEASTLPDNSMLLVLSWYRGKNGNYISPQDIASRLSKASTVPVYSLVDNYLGYGVVGGKLLSGRRQGTLAAGMALRILNGEKAGNIPILQHDESPYMYDAMQLEKWGFSPPMPPGTIIVNAEKTQRERYRKMFIMAWMIAGGLMVVLGVMSIYLLGQRTYKRKLSESESRFRAFTEGTVNITVVIDREGKYLYLSPSSLAEYGYAPVDVREKMSVGDLTHPDDVESYKKGIETILTGKRKTVKIGPIRIKPKNSCKWQYLEGILSDMLDVPGVNGIVGHFVDCTDRVKAEKALEEHNREMKEILASITDGFMVIDNDMVLRYMNKAAYELLELDRRVEVNKPFLDIFPEAKGSIFEEKFRWAIKNKKPVAFETYFDIEPYHNWYEVKVASTAAGITVYFRVITKRKQDEECILTALKEKEVLLREIHHRVKNNLQVVASLLSLQRVKIKDDGAKHMMDESINRVKAMGLIHEKIYGTQSVSKLDLLEYIESMSKSVISTLSGKATHVELSVSGDRVFLDVDHAIPCALTLNELISNAIKHGFKERENGRIEINTKLEGETLHMIVRDDGAGISPEVDLTAPKTLGLQLIYNLARQIGGEVRVESSSNGTTFHLTCKGAKLS